MNSQILSNVNYKQNGKLNGVYSYYKEGTPYTTKQLKIVMKSLKIIHIINPIFYYK